MKILGLADTINEQKNPLDDLIVISSVKRIRKILGQWW